MQNLKHISNIVGLPLSLQGGDVMVDATFPNLKEARLVGHKILLLLPPFSVVILRYWNAAMTVEFPYSLYRAKSNTIKAGEQNGTGSMGLER